MRTALTGILAAAALLLVTVPATATTTDANPSEPVVAAAPLGGDTNGDGVIDTADYMALKRHFGFASAGNKSQGDLNGNGVTGVDDLELLGLSFSPPQEIPPVGTIPEPLTMAMFGIGAMVMGGHIRRRLKTT